MAMGCKASLEHAVPHVEKAGELLARIQEDARFSGAELNDEGELVRELTVAVAYLADAVRYLSEGQP